MRAMKYELVEITAGVIRPGCKYLAMSIAAQDAVKKNIAAGEERFAVRRLASNTIVRVGMVR